MGPSPHIRTSETVESVMYDVIIALIPAFLVAVYVFGLRAVIVTGVAVLTCLVTEYVCQKIMKQDISIFDGSAVLTGILFSFVIPVIMPLPYVIIGCIIAIALGKMVYGDRKSTRLNTSHANISYAVFCLKKKNLDDHGIRGR